MGINHRTAVLDVREKLWFSDAELRFALPVLKNQFFSECFILSTCNRTELYGILDSQKVPSLTPSIVSQISEALTHLKSAESVNQQHLYAMGGLHSAAHLFKVAGGIDSMVLGDIQILHQVKTHFNLALEEQTVGPYLNRLVQVAYRVGKRVRTETTICEGAVSVSYAAVELANKIFSNLSEKSAMLIGAGETGELTAKNLVGKGMSALFVANRTRSKAEELVATLGGTVVDYDQLQAKLVDVDIVISSVNSPTHVLESNHVRQAMKKRSNSPLMIIDIGVPRNIDPAVNKLENVFVHDMDSLGRIVDQNLQRRKAEIPSVNAIVMEELIGIRQWFESLQVNPTINDLREFFEAVRAEEVKKHINRFSEDDRELVELVTKRITNKLLHLPTIHLKNENGESVEERHTKIHLVRGLFGLHKKEISLKNSESETKE